MPEDAKEAFAFALLAWETLHQRPANVPGATGAKKAVVLEVRCACGATMKFRDPPAPGFPPLPGGGVATCPSCGRAQDLKEIQRLRAAAQV